MQFSNNISPLKYVTSDFLRNQELVCGSYYQFTLLYCALWFARDGIMLINRPVCPHFYVFYKTGPSNPSWEIHKVGSGGEEMWSTKRKQKVPYKCSRRRAGRLVAGGRSTTSSLYLYYHPGFLFFSNVWKTAVRELPSEHKQLHLRLMSVTESVTLGLRVV